MSGEWRTHRSRRRPTWIGFACALVLLTTHHSPRTTAQEKIPVSGRPTSDFYGAAGVGVKVAWSLDRTTVALDEELVATLTVTNATNPRDITRPDLKAMPKFNRLFVVIDLPDPTPAANAKEVKFSYRLRPRDLAVKEVPRLDFYYYNRTAAVGQDWPLTQAKAVPITVRPAKPKPKPPAVPLREPEHLFAVARGASVLDGPPFSPCEWAWGAAWLAGPLVAIAWFLVWRRVFPDAARLAKLRRSRAARRAQDAIRRAGRTPDPPAALVAAVLGYLRSRFPLPPGAATPTEVAAALAELELPAAERDTVVDFLRACDEARFSPSGEADASLAATAAALVTRLEAA
jgi:hypothetical protein